MLEALRNSVNTWTAKILLGLLVVSFAVWGVADVFTGRTDSVVASVGENGEIEAQQYALSMSDQLQNLQRQTGQAVSLSDARSLGLDDLVLAQLSTREALNQEAQVFGLSASDSDIRDAISNAPSFQGPGGTFDRTTYERQVRNRGLTVKNFEQEVRVDLARESMLQAVGVGTSAPRPLAEALYRFRNERRQLDYILLTPSMADDPGEPDEETLTAFHSANAEDFTAPEYRKVDIVWLTPDAFADEIEIPEERIVATYEERRNAGEFTTLATRTVEQLLFDTEEDATAARARIDSGEATFADLAAEKEQTAADISLGEVEQADLPAAYADAAFGVEEPGILGPVKNVFGWALLNVTAVKPESIATLEDERQRIRDDLASAEARNLIPEEMVAVDDELAGGATPEAAARLTAAKYVMLDGIDEMGRTVEGRPNAGVPPIPGILDTIFSTETGIEPVLTEADSGGFYALRVEEVIPAALRPLEEVRDEVAAAWEREQRTAALSEIADGYRDRFAGDETLEQIAESEGYRIATTGPILRNSPSGTLTQVLRDTMFRVDEGDLLRGPNSDGSGYVFGVLAEIVHEDAEAVEAAIDVETERYAAALSNDLVQTFTRTAQERHPTRVHPAVVESVLSELGQRY